MHAIPSNLWDRRGRNRIAIGFTTTYAISAYHHLRCECESRSGEVYSIQHYVVRFVSDLRWFSPVSSTNKAGRHDIAEIYSQTFPCGHLY